MRAVLPHLVGTVQLRTAAGSAYLCCAAPRDGRESHRASAAGREEAHLAGGLDPTARGGGGAGATGVVPAVDLSEEVGEGIVDTSGQGSAAGNLLGNLLGDALGDALGDLLS